MPSKEMPMPQGPNPTIFPDKVWEAMPPLPPRPQPPKGPPRTVQNFPAEALRLGQMQVEMGRLDNDPELVANGESLIRRAQAELARRAQAQQPPAAG
jgi:hypothetical protein